MNKILKDGIYAAYWTVTEPRLMGLCAYMEARNQGRKGLMAVMQVIMNRSRLRKTGVREIIMEERQFSWTNPDDPQFELSGKYLESIIKGHKLDLDLIYSIQFAGYLFDGDMVSWEVKNATHYYNPKVTDPIGDGRWDKDKMQYCATIGSHVFYHEKGYGGIANEEKGSPAHPPKKEKD